MPVRRWPRRTDIPNREFCAEDTALIDETLEKLLRERTIEETTAHDAWVLSPLHVVRNDKKPRVVVDMRRSGLNEALDHLHLSMNGVRTVRELIMPGALMFSADIKSAFHHVRVAPRYRPLLAFRWRARLYRFRALPFGLSASPALLDKTLHPLLAYLRSTAATTRGKVNFNLYVDDLLGVVAPDAPPPPALPLGGRAPPELTAPQQWAWWTRELLAQLQLRAAEDKCHWEPSTSIEYLGMTWESAPPDGSAPRIRLPHKKLHDLRRQTHRLYNAFSRGEPVSAQQLAQLVGKAVAALPAVVPARLYLHALQSAVVRARASRQPVRLTAEAWMELDFWRHEVVRFSGTTTLSPEPTLHLHTDSSSYGWGAVAYRQDEPARTARGYWATTRWAHEHINVKEILAVERALVALDLRQTSVLVHTDNTVTLAYINKWMGRRAAMTHAARRLFDTCQERGLTLSAVHVPGEENTLPDRLSRLVDRNDWLAAPEILDAVERRWGRLTFDRFASAASRLPGRPYNSQFYDVGTAGVDALRQPASSWRAHFNWINPPWALMMRALLKVRETGAHGVVLAPWWPAAPWWPLLWSLSAESPITFPPRFGMFKSALTNTRAPAPPWRLAAFRV